MGVLSLDVPLANETSKPQARTFYVVKKTLGPKKTLQSKDHWGPKVIQASEKVGKLSLPGISESLSRWSGKG